MKISSGDSAKRAGSAKDGLAAPAPPTAAKTLRTGQVASGREAFWDIESGLHPHPDWQKAGYRAERGRKSLL